MPAQKKQKLIIVDDSDLDCYIIKTMASYNRNTFDCSVFNTANEALDFIREQAINNTKPTIVFLDVVMPVMDGISFMKEFDKLPEAQKIQYKIFAITSTLNKNAIDEILRFKEVEQVLTKPIPEDVFARLVAV